MMLHFRKLNYSKKDKFWINFCQIPTTRLPNQLKLADYSEERVKKFWKLSSTLQNRILEPLIINKSFTVILCSVPYLFLMFKYSLVFTLIVFWTVLIVINLLIFLFL